MVRSWIAVAAALVLVGTTTVRAEMVKDVSVETFYDSNVFGTASGETDYVTALRTTFANRVSDGAGQNSLYYSGTGYLFGQSRDRSFSVHALGVSYVQRLGSKRNRLRAGASAVLRLDRSIYEVYDYGGFRAFADVTWYPVSRLMVRSGYNLTTRNYWNLDTSSYADHRFHAQVSRFFATRTTLRGDASYGFKSHYAEEAQVLAGIQIAQSLTPTTGLSVRYQRRINTIAAEPNLLLDGTAFTVDEDLLVDRYDYSGHEWNTRLTQLVPLGARLILEGGYESQRFDGQPALDESGDPVSPAVERLDRIAFGGATLEVPVTASFDMSLGYQYEQARSNDAYYDYDGRKIWSLNLKYGF